MAWTDERIDRLKALWAQGMTASQIADELGGISRNAVIGKAHRLGLEARPSPVRGPDAPADEGPGDEGPGDEVSDGEMSADEPLAFQPLAFQPLDEAPAEGTPVVAAEAAGEVEEAPAIATDVPAEDEAEDEAEDDEEETAAAPGPAPAPQQLVRSIGPGGFERQMPGEGQVPIPPAPPRRLVPAKPSAEVAGKTGLLDLNDRICKWPLGHPGEPDFHFCGEKVNPGFPYCLDHCSVAYQAQLPRRDRRPPPPMPYGGPRVR